jgi:cysteine sulfinate desulfinase/cysteine desulfurase-like protein
MDQNEVNILRGLLTSAEQRRPAGGRYYLPDYAATTLVIRGRRGFGRMLHRSAELASATHAPGSRRRSSEAARAQVASLITHPRAIIFTSGATEQPARCWRGARRLQAGGRGHTRFAHRTQVGADTVKQLEREGFAVTLVSRLVAAACWPRRRAPHARTR